MTKKISIAQNKNHIFSEDLIFAGLLSSKDYQNPEAQGVGSQ